MKGLNMMYSYKGKIAGFIIAGIGLVAMLIQKFTHFTFIKKLNSEQHFSLLLWLTLFGLFMAALSKEKHEDERVEQVRGKSFMHVFAFMFGVTLAFALTMSITPATDAEASTIVPGDVVMLGRMLMFYPAVAIVLYLVMFHVGLHFDQAWDYENQTWSYKTLWKYKRYRLLFIVIGLVITTLIFFLIQ